MNPQFKQKLEEEATRNAKLIDVNERIEARLKERAANNEARRQRLFL